MRKLLIACWLTTVGLIVFASWSCTPTGPTINFNNSNNATNNGGGGPTATPSPGTNGTLPPGSTVRVGIFGHDCPTGVTPPNNSSGQIKASCRGAGITATPKGPDGVDLDATVHGTEITWAVVSGSVQCTGFYLGNAFNQFCSCPTGAVGSSFSLTAKVKNVTGTLNGSCVS